MIISSTLLHLAESGTIFPNKVFWINFHWLKLLFSKSALISNHSLSRFANCSIVGRSSGSSRVESYNNSSNSTICSPFKIPDNPISLLSASYVPSNPVSLRVKSIHKVFAKEYTSAFLPSESFAFLFISGAIVVFAPTDSFILVKFSFSG